MSKETAFLVDILERINSDPDLVREVNGRADLGYPDLHVALVLARRVDEDAGGPE